MTDRTIIQPRAEFFASQKTYLKALGLEARNVLKAEMHPMFTVVTLAVRDAEDKLIYDADDPQGIRTETVTVGMEWANKKPEDV